MMVSLPSGGSKNNKKKDFQALVALLADNFGSHDTEDPALQDPQVKWILLPLLYISLWIRALLLH